MSLDTTTVDTVPARIRGRRTTPTSTPAAPPSPAELEATTQGDSHRLQQALAGKGVKALT
jgi:hypothetical protein